MGFGQEIADYKKNVDKSSVSTFKSTDSIIHEMLFGEFKLCYPHLQVRVTVYSYWDN
jgi:hypothetical protein